MMRKMEMDVMSSKEIEEAIEKIKMELPADDKSHFSFDKKERNDNDNDATSDNDLDSLWDIWENLNERGIGDKSEEGQELRDAIREFIDTNELNVRVTRNKTNEDLLTDIEDALEVAKNSNNRSDANSSTINSDGENSSSVQEATLEPEPTQNQAEPGQPPYTGRRRGEHNDDTDEPAATRFANAGLHVPNVKKITIYLTHKRVY